MPPRARCAAAFAAGVLAVAGFAPFGAYPVPVLALAGLLWLWDGAPARVRFLTGFAFGAGLFGAGASWVYVSLHDFGMMPAPLAAIATAGFCAILALYPAAAGAAIGLFERMPRVATLLAFPALWTLSEWLRGWIFTGFPWLAMGYSQAGHALGELAAIVGVYGVSFAVALGAALLYTALRRTGGARVLGAAGLIALYAAGQGLKAIEWTQPEGPPLRVALLQGNIPQDLKFLAERYPSTLATYARLVAQSDARLIVLPETAIPRFLDSVEPVYVRHLAALARDRRADLLLGVPTRSADGYFNSVVSLGASPVQRYSKSHLVPFGEFVPPGFGWIVRILSIPLSDFSAGPDRPVPLAVAGQRVAVNICYEDAFGEEIIRQLPQATLLVNVSNVAWFGDSLAPAQHLQISRMRSIETGRYMLRATNTGVTAVIDERGSVVARLPQFTEGVLHAEARGRTGATPYVRWGNYPVLAACLFLLAAARLIARPGRAGPAGESR